MNEQNLNCRSNRGLGLVELMVGMVIGLVTLLVVTQVMQSFEGQKRTSTGGNDAQTNGALALYLLDREIRMAGYGVAGPEGMLCRNGINSYFDPGNGDLPKVTVGGAFLPIRIKDGPDGKPDQIEITVSNAEFGSLPMTIVKPMPLPSSVVTVDLGKGLKRGDLFILASKSGSKRCTLMQMTLDEPQATGNGFNLQNNSGQGAPYNPPNPEKAYGPDAETYGIDDIVVNLGPSPLWRRFIVPPNSDQLVETDPSGSRALVDGIVDIQAVYGVAPEGSNTISQWVPAVGDFDESKLNATLAARIRAVRLAVVARSPQYEKEAVTGAAVELWDGGPSYSPTDDGRHYRYKVFETIIPLRNVIWSAS